MVDPNWDYTKDELRKNMVLFEAHMKNNTCPDCVGKHLITIEGLAEEGMSMTPDEQERLRLLQIADWARRTRKQLAGMS